MQHLALWINSKSISTTDIIKTSKTQLDTHVNEIKSALSQTVQTITETTKNAQIECNKLNIATTNNSKTSLGIVEQNDKQMRNIHNDLKKSETSAIAAVNICANRRKAEIETKLAELESMLHTFDSKKSIPQDCLQEVNKAIKLLREEM